ncbi:pyridoxamine 5'-phosphate oxidase family protein [Nocardia pseudobrasiliensis]|uniref:Nitroimidazol reductase NimA-like FMN-containing flavoprotein (Pyridoxamine 5'-phosphate oxidase superfamily) n=1 Tax=Nocardia pseudobrasiliensis TaxID=45979 RepID=A0A370HZE4_9NOCA|nr:pyridoxamine 5'-phosphate oxidase family protein [Nocardia pseudobrasiliensis]RDI63849.1 nitroimidazol reductase NimA-like FMN-containing flavoprotein (pyridoxamine 5'-phosphate oxidase superfamily) [Nocardia pseudobrasiliensis]
MTSRADEYPRFTRPPHSVQQVTRDLSTAEAFQLLSRVGVGRIVYTRYALPTIRPVNHLLDGETIVIHAHRGATLTADRQVVAYEADTIDERTRHGWCVIVTGTAEPITDPQQIAHYRTLLRPWLPGPRDQLVRIDPDIITGVEFVDPDPV